MYKKILALTSLFLLKSGLASSQNQCKEPVNCSKYGFEGEVPPDAHTVILFEEHAKDLNTYRCTLHLINTLGRGVVNSAYVYAEAIQRGEVKKCHLNYTNNNATPVVCSGWDDAAAAKETLSITRRKGENGLDYNTYASFIRHFVNHDLANIYKEERAKGKSPSETYSEMDQVLVDMIAHIKRDEHPIILRAVEQVQAWRNEGLSYKKISKKDIAYNEGYTASAKDLQKLSQLNTQREASLAIALGESLKNSTTLGIFTAGAAHKSALTAQPYLEKVAVLTMQ